MGSRWSFIKEHDLTGLHSDSSHHLTWPLEALIRVASLCPCFLSLAPEVTWKYSLPLLPPFHVHSPSVLCSLPCHRIATESAFSKVSQDLSPSKLLTPSDRWSFLELNLYTSLLLSSAPTSNGKLQLDSHPRSALLSSPVLSQWRHQHPPSRTRQILQGCLTLLSSPPHPGLPTHSARHQVLSVPPSVPSISPCDSQRTVLGQGLGTIHWLVHSPFPCVPGSKLLPLIRPPSHQISLEIRALVTPLKHLNILQTFGIRTKLFKMTFNTLC